MIYIIYLFIAAMIVAVIVGLIQGIIGYVNAPKPPAGSSYEYKKWWYSGGWKTVQEEIKETQNLKKAIELENTPRPYAHGRACPNRDYSSDDDSTFETTDDEMFSMAVDVVFEEGKVSVPLLQRELEIDYNYADHLIRLMEKYGIVSVPKSGHPRKILITEDEWFDMEEQISEQIKNHPFDGKTISSDSADSITRIDGMDGHEFEHYCAELLRKNGYEKVSVTPASGDQGVDVLAERDGVRFAIQCKNYSSQLGNTPVQEVNAGKVFYHCHVAVVMTNSTFTNGAKELAKATGVLLWDRVVVEKMIQDTFNIS